MSPQKPDPATWLSTADVARQLGVKPRTVIDLVQRGKLGPKKYQRPGHSGGKVSLFDPAEVQALIDQRLAAKTEVVPINDPGPLVRSPLAVVRAPEPAAVPFMHASVPIPQKRYLSLEEAVAYTGLGAGYIGQHCESWPIGPHRKRVFRREDLDQL